MAVGQIQLVDLKRTTTPDLPGSRRRHENLVKKMMAMLAPQFNFKAKNPTRGKRSRSVRVKTRARKSR